MTQLELIDKGPGWTKRINKEKAQVDRDQKWAAFRQADIVYNQTCVACSQSSTASQARAILPQVRATRRQALLNYRQAEDKLKNVNDDPDIADGFAP